jgi:hypothetical protein
MGLSMGEFLCDQSNGGGCPSRFFNFLMSPALPGDQLINSARLKLTGFSTS